MALRIGIIIAVVAVLDIHMDRNHVGNIIPSNSLQYKYLFNPRPVFTKLLKAPCRSGDGVRLAIGRSLVRCPLISHIDST
ncbi:hypothetical protein DPMN_012375 [Dreissena polymorpha]|uniref:Secreted protein n=1 Tax=Dreissena polymorpha TaxID=45954 RepID=A0A9D4N7W4_DREPO|nr:hypothetical protein DPMN_012375 [Dreissena polymorpha]